MKKYLIPFFLLVLSTAAFAQTDTPTDTPTNTPTRTPTNTPTNTPTRTPTITPTTTTTPTDTPTKAIVIPTPGSTDFSAFKYGSFKADPGNGISTADVIIPGLKQGDAIVVYPPVGYAMIVAWQILTNNTLRLSMLAGSDLAIGDFEYVWFDRTQRHCEMNPYCGRAPTVTPTPA